MKINDYEVNKGTIKESKYFQKIVIFVSVFFMIIPLFFISDEIVKSNSFLMEFSNLFIEYFYNINRASTIAINVDLENKIRFIYTYSLFISLIICFLMLYFYGKAYLCSWGMYNKCTKDYLIEKIQKNGTDRTIGMLLYSIIYTILLFEIIYLGYIINYVLDGLTASYIFKNSFTVTMLCIIGCLLGSNLAYIILEFFAHVRKLIKRIKSI